jgi:hypothetical protein
MLPSLPGGKEEIGAIQFRCFFCPSSRVSVELAPRKVLEPLFVSNIAPCSPTRHRATEDDEQGLNDFAIFSPLGLVSGPLQMHQDLLLGWVRVLRVQ